MREAPSCVSLRVRVRRSCPLIFIKQAVTVTQNADVNIVYVDVTAEFAGHGIFSPNRFINRPGTKAAFHPNALGYSVYAIAITDALPNGWVDKSSRIVASS